MPQLLFYAFHCPPRTCCQCFHTSMPGCCSASPAASSGTTRDAVFRRPLVLTATRLQPWLAMPHAF